LLALAPALLVAGCINYFVDPAHIFFSKNYVSELAGILSRGHNADNVTNYDERLLQEQMVMHLARTPDIVALGSSRIMQVGSQYFPGKTVLNCGVSHANIKDVIAIIGLLDSLHRLPREIILNTDVGLIGSEQTDEWKSLEPYYDHFMQAAGLPVSPRHFWQAGGTKQLKSIFSLEYLHAAMAFALKKKSAKYIDVDNRRPVLGGRFFDGSIAYDDAYMNGSEKQRAQFELETGRKDGVPAPDKQQQQLLLQVLDFLAKKNINVHFYLMPYHPALYTAVNQYHNDQFKQYENYFRQTAQKRNLPIRGSFDPAVYGIGDTMFYDMYHCSAQAIEKIILK